MGGFVGMFFLSKVGLDHGKNFIPTKHPKMFVQPFVIESYSQSFG
jgi:hypothetical protein